MTPEQKQQRIKEIEAHRAKMIFPSGRPTGVWAYVDDLLSLVKSQEAETLQLRKEAASEVWDSERAIHKTKCPDCPHSIGLHALDSRIVGCTAGDGSEEDPICGCRTLYGEGIATSMRSCCVEKVRAMGQQWYADAKKRGAAFSDKTRLAEMIAKELESVSIQEQVNEDDHRCYNKGGAL